MSTPSPSVDTALELLRDPGTAAREIELLDDRTGHLPS